jgi:hypothetical protein
VEETGVPEKTTDLSQVTANLYYYIGKIHDTTTTKTPNKFSEYHVPIYKFSI